MKGIEEIEEAEIATFTPVELKEYEDSLKAYRDIKNSIDTARKEGRVEGRVEGRLEEKIAIARNLKSMGMSISDISKACRFPTSQRPQACRKRKLSLFNSTF